uniref:Beta-1,4-glucuronyltransferase 1 n=1 Tax=Anopheles dirus TaxID=7168 RepID=A0A182NEN0_9DIPT
MRRNWLLRCSILINVAVMLYVGSHMLIGSGNFALGPAYIISDEVPKQPASEQYKQYLPPQQRLLEAEQQLFEQQQQQQSPQQGHSSLVLKIQENGIGVQEVLQQSSQQQRQLLPSGVGAQQLQQQQQQQQQEQLMLEVRDVDNSNLNVDDSRFDVPTEKSTVRKLVGGDVLYQDGQQAAGGGGGGVGGGGVGAGGPGATGVLNGSDIFSTTASMDVDAKLRSLLNCHDRDYEPYIGQRGDFWVLKNYIRAEHGDLRCHETITYTTHADYTFLDNLVPLLERWNAPVPKHNQVLDTPYNCSLALPYFNVSVAQLYKTQKKLLYPVNVGRNIARDAAMTHFFLASDIELYPNPGLVHKFLEMIARNEPVLQRKNPRVFPLPIFEVDNSSPVPRDKAELQELLRSGKAIPFHKRVCSSCHGVPKSKEWIAANETDDLGVFHIGKRIGYFVHWEPIYIGTHADPHYDERLSWEGKSDKMTQGYALCVLDYDFHILDNAFLVHKPGIKVLKKDPKRAMLAAKTNQLIKKIIYPELQVMYGTRKGCAMTAFSSTANYKPLHPDDAEMVARRSTVLRTVLLLVIVFFVLFCMMGYFYQPDANSRDYVRNQYLAEGASHEALLRRLKTILNCNTQPNAYQLETHGEYYLLRNFVAADGTFECYETITYTTHGDYTFLDNVVPLLERWNAPISIALYAPGGDLDRSVELIRYLLECHEQSLLVRKYVSFHLYFGFAHLPEHPIKYYRELFANPLECWNATNAWSTLQSKAGPESFREEHNLTYPVNVGRNVARSAATTHFVLASDIELYPSPDFIPMFLRMIAHPFYQYTLHTAGVYVLPVFEVAEDVSIPVDKSHLLEALEQGQAIKFHEKICSNCHTVPGYAEWLLALKYDYTMDIHVTSKRNGAYVSWEPIYVGTKREPEYDERLSWEGKADKMTQGYIMCILDYDFHVLDNGFLVHRPGIKTAAQANRPPQQAKQRSFMRKTISREIAVLYGEREGCRI